MHLRLTVAKEMKRRGMKVALLIGGATTSRMHTAVKIEPRYDQPVMHVLDASRAVTVVSSLFDPELKADTKELYQEMREDKLTASYAEKNDDYGKIMAQALGDRLADSDRRPLPRSCILTCVSSSGATRSLRACRRRT